MGYASFGQEWDETYAEMGKFSPEAGDKVLCCAPEVHAGTVVEVETGFFIVQLDDGSVDRFADEDVLKRKIANDAHCRGEM